MSLPRPIFPLFALAILLCCLHHTPAAEDEMPSAALGFLLEDSGLEQVRLLPDADPDRPAD